MKDCFYGEINMYYVIHKNGGILYFDKSLFTCMQWVQENEYMGLVEYKYKEN